MIELLDFLRNLSQTVRPSNKQGSKSLRATTSTPPCFLFCHLLAGNNMKWPFSQSVELPHMLLTYLGACGTPEAISFSMHYVRDSRYSLQTTPAAGRPFIPKLESHGVSGRFYKIEASENSPVVFKVASCHAASLFALPLLQFVVNQPPRNRRADHSITPAHPSSSA